MNGARKEENKAKDNLAGELANDVDRRALHTRVRVFQLVLQMKPPPTLRD